jgi:formamidopyrimidine-DNA glycosylase
MPELPEVENIKLQINNRINEPLINTVSVNNFKLRKLINESIFSDLENNTLSHFSRYGKYLTSKISDKYLLIHLGMSGKIRVENNYNAIKHDHVIIGTSQGFIIYNDARRFGLFQTVQCKKELFKIIGNGVEPLSEYFNEDYLYHLSHKNYSKIKLLLLDQKNIRGIGNIYASEILFESGIHPCSISCKITKKKLSDIVSNTKIILNRSILNGGTTFKDFSHLDGEKGGNLKNLKVYGKEGVNCQNCNGLIRNVNIGNRSTFYCFNCQTEYY